MRETLGIVLFLVALMLAIFFHEGGHFLTAKAFGMRVERFFLGFGKTLFSFRRGETEYGIKALPLGGFCKISGMSRHEADGGESLLERERRAAPVASGSTGEPGSTGATVAVDQSRMFYAKPAWQRAIVLSAGSLTHFVVGFLLLYLVLVGIGETIVSTRLSAVVPTVDGHATPAAAAGLRAGDRIVAVNGRTTSDFDQLRKQFSGTAGRSLTVTVERNGTRTDKVVQPARVTDPNGCVRNGYLGVQGSQETRRAGVLAGIPSAGRVFGDIVAGSFRGIASIGSGIRDRLLPPVAVPPTQAAVCSGATSGGGGSGGVVGLVGIVRLAGQAVSANQWVDFLFLLITFNIFVGIVNLLPIPPMDGGYLGFVVFEKLFRREVDLRKVAPVAAAIVGLLVILTVGLVYLDITNPISNPFR